MSVAGGAVGLIAGGLLTTYAVLAVGAVRQRADRAGGRPGRAAGAPRVRGGSGAGSTCPARSPGPAGSPRWSTACPARPPARTASPTGAMPRSSPRWRPRWCCSPRSRSSRPAARHALLPPAPAGRPQPDRREPDHAVRRRRHLRHVLLPDRVHAVRLGLLGAEDRPGLPAADRRNHGVLRHRRPAHPPGRCPAAAAGGRPDCGWRPVLAVAARRARQLRRRGARPDAGHRRRPRPAVRAAHPRRHVQGRRRGVRGRGQPAQHRPAGRRLDRARRARHRRLDRRRQQHPRPGRPAPRPPPPGPATRRGPARQRSPRSTTTPWPPASPAPSWSRPASCCSP